MAQVITFNIKQWIKISHHPLAALLRRAHKISRQMNFPVIPLVHSLLLRCHLSFLNIWQSFWQFFYFTPLFKSRLNKSPSSLHLYSGMPQIGGSLTISVGEGCRISGRSSFFGRTASMTTPLLQVGGNVDIGWQNTIAVGTKVIIGNNVRLAGNIYLAGFPGHPVDPLARARGESETDDQVGDIVLEDNVWLATGVTVLAGVTIGHNSIIAAGSVVTKDIPANVIAAGVPARVIRVLVEEVL